MNLNAAHGILFHEVVHLLLSLLVAFFIWRIFKDKKAALIAFLIGIFIDIDHWFDYFIWFGLKINWEKNKDKRPRVGPFSFSFRSSFMG